MTVNAHHGWNGMNVKFTTNERLAMMIPSQRAQAAPEKTLMPAAIPMTPPIRCIHPQVLAPVAIQ